MKKKLFFLICALLFNFQVYAIPNPFIYEDQLIQLKKIATTDYYCLYTSNGTAVAEKTEAGYYLPIKVKHVVKDLEKKIKKLKKKYNKTKNVALKKRYKKQIKGVNKTLSSINTCKNFNVAKLACKIFAGKNLKSRNLMVLNGAKCSNQKQSVVAMISMNYKTKKGIETAICTGTYIGEKAFLTAAHCFDDSDFLATGKTLISVDVEVAGKTYKAKRWERNPSWNKEDEVGDTALVFIGRELNKTPFKLVGKKYVPQEGELVALVGYGNVKYIDKKREVDGYYGGFLTIASVEESGLLAVYDSHSKQATICYGDSGGPLVTYIDGAWRILGTASNGDDDECGYFTGVQKAYWSRVNSPENVLFLEMFLPGIFD